MPKRSTSERNIRRRRQNGTAAHPVPGEINFQIPPEYLEIVLYDSGEGDRQRIIALGCVELLHYLNQGLFLADGTFDVVPGIFFQLYTIHCKVGHSYPPIVYFLLPNKSQETYTKMLQALRIIRPMAQPDKILLDFEIAAINAFRSEYPSATVSGCYFHLAQSVLRKVNELGLKTRYETDSIFQMLVKSLSALSFVAVADLESIFEQLANTFPDEVACNDLLVYFESNYIRGSRTGRHQRQARFPPSLWNHYDDAILCEPKTINCTEGFHNALKSLFLCSHPNIWSFLDGIKRDIAIQRLGARCSVRSC
ncbi:uncharacterized protein LOC143444882 [Clavelina lepadiformis]|uniref:uncharacterized protein LOC143444882 n=1 Tax=Clavelina lepadiformis TaxID=159417 RepID=UPI0040426B74